ncbi:MAG: hypothetical protein LBS96_08075 [Oscillospiraceae bacterium]|jgi:hypothetical protein|nr:hypothetical protein [Oscillospiraceae bacterium]
MKQKHGDHYKVEAFDSFLFLSGKLTQTCIKLRLDFAAQLDAAALEAVRLRRMKCAVSLQTGMKQTPKNQNFARPLTRQD